MIERADPSELDAFLKAHPDIEYVDALLFDLCGIVRGKRFPRHEAAKLFTSGMQIPRSIYLLDAAGNSNDPLGYGFSDGDPDGDAFPVPGTLAPIPWAKVPGAQVLMTMFDAKGGPEEKDPRGVLAGVADVVRADGLRPVMALELEFYLIDRERAADGAPQAPISPLSGQRDRATQVYGMAELDAYGDFLRDLEGACLAQHLPAYTATSEYAPGQFELNLRHVPCALTAADHAGLLKRAVKAVASKHGFEATFMAKPWLDRSGSGLHVHLSLTDDAGVNLFPGEDGRPSDLLRHAVGGLKATMAEAMALFAPSLNSFRRFQPNIYVPVAPTWGLDNRSAAFRVPGGPAEAMRIEHRVAGADANPYLTAAAVLAGAHHGISERLDPGPPSKGNSGAERDPDLPFEWNQALSRLAAAEIIPRYLGRHYVDMYVATKRAERTAFLEGIFSREYAWYL
ncbi:glutamine synthetase family protein [Roseospirillum parvum]|uniref:Glutamine synthetase n=1 Tax=Roseospirillum parvum TaxID=83401 RepID=A0A1G7V6Q2_9PROT|nr:glutamine synthetase family protein [Roseospirillum parvum]SDG55397.1 glutamine synthetase [Roseospirillum parvum]